MKTEDTYNIKSMLVLASVMAQTIAPCAPVTDVYATFDAMVT